MFALNILKFSNLNFRKLPVTKNLFLVTNKTLIDRNKSKERDHFRIFFLLQYIGFLDRPSYARN